MSGGSNLTLWLIEGGHAEFWLIRTSRATLLPLCERSSEEKEQAGRSFFFFLCDNGQVGSPVETPMQETFGQRYPEIIQYAEADS
jgi:hypothetical protein